MNTRKLSLSDQTKPPEPEATLFTSPISSFPAEAKIMHFCLVEAQPQSFKEALEGTVLKHSIRMATCFQAPLLAFFLDSLGFELRSFLGRFFSRMWCAQTWHYY